MYNHEPADYQCPFCRIAKGVEDEHASTRQADVFYRDDSITAFVSSYWWPNNEGNVIIVPNQHIENIYDLPDELSHKIHDFEKKVAIALKTVYGCDAVSSRQHNEPAGNQDTWHYHLHIFPRFENDNLYQLHDQKKFIAEERRVPFAEKLRNYFQRINS